MVFADRDDAGRRLAARLGHLRGEPVVVPGLPRGGVPAAFQVARAPGAPLDVIVVREPGVPFRPGPGAGTAGVDGVRVINPQIADLAGVPQNVLAAVQARAQAEVGTRARRYRPARPREPPGGRVAVVAGDGTAAGSTARAACQIARAAGAVRVVLAVPAAPPGWQARTGADAGELARVSTPPGFRAIGRSCARFPPVSGEEVIACPERAAVPPSPAPAGTVRAAAAVGPPGREQQVRPGAGVVRLAGCLTVPEDGPGIVVFAHGSGSSRHSPRNRYVAGVLNQAGLGTLLVDLLTPRRKPTGPTCSTPACSPGAWPR